MDEQLTWTHKTVEAPVTVENLDTSDKPRLYLSHKTEGYICKTRSGKLFTATGEEYLLTPEEAKMIMNGTNQSFSIGIANLDMLPITPWNPFAERNEEIAKLEMKFSFNKEQAYD